MNRHTLAEYELERSHELDRSLARDLEREPHTPTVRFPARRKQFRYWAGLSFRPVRGRSARGRRVS